MNMNLCNSRFGLSRDFQTALGAVLITLGADAAQAQVCNEIGTLDDKLGESHDEFGWSIDVDGSTVVVGVPGDRVGGESWGEAILYDAQSGDVLVRLFPPDEVGGRFGAAVAIDGEFVGVGDPSGKCHASAYVFDSTSGEPLAQLRADEIDCGALFGHAVSVDQGVVAVGAPWADLNGDYSGVVFLYDAPTGARKATLLAGIGIERQFFGTSVAMDDGVVAVGAPGESVFGEGSGAAYLFDADTGEQIHKLAPTVGQRGDHFGESIAISDGIVAVGTPYDDTNASDSGAVYLFDVVSGAQLFKLTPADGTALDKFGITVSIDGGRVIGGAPLESFLGDNNGAAYIFDVASGIEMKKLAASDTQQDSRFGSALASSAGLIVVGAPGHDDHTGSAYLFDPDNCPGLSLKVDNLAGGQVASFTLNGGTPGARAVTVYGFRPGQTRVRYVDGYCATFGIRNVNRSRIIEPDLDLRFDHGGRIDFEARVPAGASGVSVLFQSAEQGTCPGERVSNLVEAVVE